MSRISLLIFLMPWAIFAETELSVLHQKLTECRNMQQDQARLKCYDNLPISFEDSFGIEKISAKTTATKSSSGTVATTSPEPSKKEEADSIESRLVGPFTGWNGKTIFKLENGQVWQQSEKSNRHSRLDSPKVTISRGWLGTYRLKVEGMNASVRVKRIK
ncbi:MAG: hypothetical protein AAGB12_03645 [Pseudomonadota bacterium]